MTTRSRHIVRVAIATGLLLLVPLVAMQFSKSVLWTASDFVAAAAILFGAGLTYVLVSEKGGNVLYRAGVGVAVLTGLLLIWMNVAVGLIGDENNLANLMFFGLPLLALVGAFIARFQPRGMAFALFVTALAQLGTAAYALATGYNREMFLLSGYAVLWAGAGLLFWASAKN